MHKGYKTQIDQIFHETSIYKSLIICQDSSTYLQLFYQLYDDNYPVSDVLSVNKFSSNENRILMLDLVDLSNLNNLLTEDDEKKINAVFIVGCEEIPVTSFNMDVVNLYVIN